MKFRHALFLSILSTQATAEQIYRCTTETGRTVFSQLPCGEDSTKIEVTPQSTDVEDDEALEQKEENLKALDERSKRLKRRNLEAKLNRLEGRRNGLASKRDKKIAELRKKLREAFDFREQAIIESRIEEAKDQYWDDRRKLDDKISDVRSDLFRCCH